MSSRGAQSFPEHKTRPLGRTLRRVAIIDIDGCVTDTYETLVVWRERDGLPPMSRPRSWEWTEATEEERNYALNKAYKDPRFYREMRPLAYAKNGLWFLSGHYDIVFMTGRAFYGRNSGAMSQEVADVTAEWLRKWEMPPHQLLHVHTSHKGEVARDIYGDRVAFSVEDAPSAALSYVEAGINTYLVTYEYNEVVPPSPLIYRVDTFNDICHHRAQVDRRIVGQVEEEEGREV